MATFRDYMDISKPRIITLLLVVAWASMFVASRGFPPLIPFLAVTVAGTMATASSGAFNHVLEKNRDAQMGRTKNRPLPSGRLSVRNALIYAILTGIIGIAVLIPISTLAASLNAAAIAYYVLFYTIVLKPTTPQNIVIGGFAGSFPALIGWAAVMPTLAWPAWILALLVFFWTPPHFWALALLYQEDYQAANYPMMPNIRGVASTKRQIFGYAFLTVATSVSLVLVADVGYLYIVAAAVLGAILLMYCEKILENNNRKRYRKLFLFTIQYLGFLLIALMIDQAIVSRFDGFVVPLNLSQ